MVLFKMLNRGVFDAIHGCVSTGKEANVYHATVRAKEKKRADGKAKEAGNVEGGQSETVEVERAGAQIQPSSLPPSSTPASAADPAACTPSDEPRDVAIKVYKTSILVFKDRGRYVLGDARFSKYSKSNPRKMVKMWAEKEMRNLSRLVSAGIPAPRPLQLRLHILAMEFVGTAGVAAPRLKDASLSPARMRAAYLELLLIMRRMFQVCRLVHADLSEYNILFHKDQLWIIDVSQSVDLDHPRALDFLKEDALHVNDFFRRGGVATLSVKEAFEFVIDPLITDNNIDDELDALMALAANRPVLRGNAGVGEEEEAGKEEAGGEAGKKGRSVRLAGEAAEVGALPCAPSRASHEPSVDDLVWAQTYIPRKLEEVTHYERDHSRAQGKGSRDGLTFHTLSGMEADMSAPRTLPAGLGRLRTLQELTGQDEERREAKEGKEDVGKEEISEESGSEESGSEDDSDSSAFEERPTQSKEERREERRQNKKEVRAANSERRKTKMPKKEKKKKMNKSKNKKK
ncbi:RIO1 family protein [Helicosporidium sp. ATCC 50920]|nr:RIO1 family protein [Helicosporidium sp. ATCC 50920]|eukprot:KDD73464.1 RIO1 family protein [Helicosporidium sp. ATCC 50920]